MTSFVRDLGDLFCMQTLHYPPVVPVQQVEDIHNHHHECADATDCSHRTGRNLVLRKKVRILGRRVVRGHLDLRERCRQSDARREVESVSDRSDGNS